VRNAELLAERRALKTSEAHLARRDAELTVRDARDEENAALHMGTYYATLGEVWKAFLMMRYEKDHFDSLFRSECPIVFVETFMAAMDRDNVVVDAWTSPRSDVDDEHTDAGPTDIFGHKDDSIPIIAHLIPTSSAHASMYDDVADWALGLTPTFLLNHPIRDPLNEAEIAELAAIKQKAIHGARPNCQGGRSDRIVLGTGLKHSPGNKLRLDCQADFFDRNPCVVIVPIMDLAQMKAWHGEGYEAIVMADSWVNETGGKITIQIVCKKIGMNERGPTARPEEIEMARKLLESVICGMAFSLQGKDHPLLPKDSLEPFTQLQKDFPELYVTVPLLQTTDIRDLLRVRKVAFGPVGDRSMHPAPDALLLAVKAAVVWSTRHKQQLLAGGELEDDTDIRSLQAMEDYLTWLDQLSRPKSLEDLGTGLGQPSGYHHATKAGV
jgi:hypothetical protein